MKCLPLLDFQMRIEIEFEGEEKKRDRMSAFESRKHLILVLTKLGREYSLTLQWFIYSVFSFNPFPHLSLALCEHKFLLAFQI